MEKLYIDNDPFFHGLSDQSVWKIFPSVISEFSLGIAIEKMNAEVLFFLFCFVTGVTSQKCRRAPHSKLCQSPSHFRHRLVLEPGYPMSGILQSLLWAYYPGISHRASRTDLQWIIDRPVMRLCYQEAVSYYCSVIVGKPYLTILRGSTGYGGSLLSPLKPCVEHAHRIVRWR